MRVVVTSNNPVKLHATKQAFEKVFPTQLFEYVTVAAASGVSDQPMNSDETLEGARNRIINARREIPDGDYYVGLEGGLEVIGDDIECAAWMVVSDKNNQEGKARTATFSLPREVKRLILEEGMELGHADDKVFGRINSKHQNGMVGLLTDDVIDRTEYYMHALVLALIPFNKKDFYENKKEN